MKYILFSPVGGHDPIANFHDGALLHICRVYKPEKVYMYLSNEMLERHELNNRYVKTLELLGEHLNHTFTEITPIKRDNLINVHFFDEFYFDFNKIIQNIVKDNPDSQILLNISSGTPAMKSALHLIAATSLFGIKSIQVSTPNKAENISKENPNDYDIQTSFECNEDNNENFEIRCFEAKIQNIMFEMKIQSIIKLINAYDYKAACMLANEVDVYLNKEILACIRSAYSRLQLDVSGYSKEIAISKMNFKPNMSGDKLKIFEYVLMLIVKQKQGNYADFIRGLTPVLLDIFENCLLKECGINIKDYCIERKTRTETIYNLSKSKMLETAKGMEICDTLNSEYRGNFEDNKPYSTTYIFPIIKYYSTDSKLIESLELLEKVRSNVRNLVAHEIVGVTDNWIEKRIGKNSQTIITNIKYCISKCGMNIKSDYWNSYDDMNNKIILELLEFK